MIFKNDLISRFSFNCVKYKSVILFWLQIYYLYLYLYVYIIILFSYTFDSQTQNVLKFHTY